MGRSLHLGTYFGIPVYVHWSFVLLLAYIAYSGLSMGMDPMNLLWFFVYILLMFLCVTLHEFGHALTARRFNIRTQDIILSPIGGVARLTKMPKQWHEEFLIAVAGPAVNLVIVILGLGFYYLFTGSIYSILPRSNSVELFVDNIQDHLFFLVIMSNIVLAVFNMLPAFPMDGGRVLRALLSIRLTRLNATLIAARLGQLLSVVFIGYMFYYFEPINILIGTFIFLAATAELRSVRYHEWLEQLNPLHAAQLSIKVHTLDEIGYDDRKMEDNFWEVTSFDLNAPKKYFKSNTLGELHSLEVVEIDGEVDMEQINKIIRLESEKAIILHNESIETFLIDRSTLNMLPKKFMQSRKRKLTKK